MKSVFLLIMMTTCVCVTSLDVQKAFTEHEVIPDVLKVAPKKLLDVSYSSGVTADLGNELKPTQVKDAPQVKWEAENGAYYLILMVDPDGPTRSSHSLREIRHWLVMNIPGSSVEKGDEVIQYIGAGPPYQTGLHRYILLVFKQPNGKIDHNEPHTTNRSMDNRPMTFVLDFAKKYNLGDPEFGNFFQAQYDEYSDILLKEMGLDALVSAHK